MEPKDSKDSKDQEKETVPSQPNPNLPKDPNKPKTERELKEERATVFPSWRYHPVEEPRLVKDAEEEKHLGAGWTDAPKNPDHVLPRIDRTLHSERDHTQDKNAKVPHTVLDLPPDTTLASMIRKTPDGIVDGDHLPRPDNSLPPDASVAREIKQPSDETEQDARRRKGTVDLKANRDT